MLCRNLERGQAAQTEIHVASDNPNVELVLGDLFLLTNLLFDSLKAGVPSRVVTISGAGHKAGVERGNAATIDVDNFQGKSSLVLPRHPSGRSWPRSSLPSR
jgi:hypothetical protein